MKIVLEPKKTYRVETNTKFTLNPIGAVNKNAHGDMFWGDNLLVMQELLKSYKNKIDLIYIDPPFGTNNAFKIGDNRTATISHSKQDNLAYADTLTGDDFLFFLQQRLQVMYPLLSPSGSIYVHIDYKMGHYVKVIMDDIFGTHNFRGDICRIKCNPKNFNRKGFGNIKDVILFYSKSGDFIWNEQKMPLAESDIHKLYPKLDAQGNRYTTIPLHAPGETKNGVTGGKFKGISPPAGRHWRTDPAIMCEWDNNGLIEWSKNGVPRKKVYYTLGKGVKIQDVWEFKDPQNPMYPTEKNHKMLDLIIKTSSNPNSIVMDCFAGSGSTLLAAQNNNRKWIGIDCSHESIKTIDKRFSQWDSQFMSDVGFNVFKLEIQNA